MDNRLAPVLPGALVTIDISIDEHLRAVRAARALAPEIANAAALIARSLRADGKVLLCGNGGSAADAQHFAGELIGRFYAERRPIAAMALHTDTTVMTAIGNDFGFEQVFARQVIALGRPGDVLVGITTSGASPNVLRAAEAARAEGLYVIGVTGASGGEMAALADLCLCVPDPATPRVQEVHTLIVHLVCQLVEAAMQHSAASVHECGTVLPVPSDLAAA